MDNKQIFEKVMQESNQIALASVNTVGNLVRPNIRLMCFYYDFNTKKIYFCTFKGSSKIVEFENNMNVAFTTCPLDEELAARVDEATIEQSSKSVVDILDEISKKLPLFDTIKSGDVSNIVPYEISFQKVHLHTGHNHVVILDNNNVNEEKDSYS